MKALSPLKRRSAIVLAGVLLYIVTLCLGCRAYLISEFGDADFLGVGCPSSEPERIQSIAQFTLPPSTKNLKSSCFGFKGWGANAEFEMSPADLDQFIASTRLIEPLAADVKPDDTILQGAADNATSFLYSSFEVNEFWQGILIDTSDPTTYKVYVQVYGG